MDDKETKNNQTPDDKPAYNPEDDENALGCIPAITSMLICGIKAAILLCVIFNAYIAAIVLATIDLTFWALMLWLCFADDERQRRRRKRAKPPDAATAEQNADEINPFTDF